MRRRSRLWLRTVVVVIAAGLVLGGCGSGDHDGQVGSGVKLSQYEGDAFVVSYPSGWEPHPAGKMVQHAEFEVVDLPQGEETPNASMHVGVDPGGGTLKGAVTIFLADSRIAEDFKLLVKKKVQVRGGGEGYVIRKSYRVEQGGLRLRQVDLLTLTASGKTLDVRLVCQADLYQRYKDTFRAIIDSVRITE